MAAESNMAAAATIATTRTVFWLTGSFYSGSGARAGRARTSPVDSHHR